MSGVMGNGSVDELRNSKELSLAAIKKDIEISYKYSEENYKRFREFFQITFKSGLSQADKDNLTLIGKPPIEASVMGAYLNRIRGDFSKQRPTMNVQAAEGLAIGRLDDQYLKLMKVTQAHTEEIIRQADAKGFSNGIYRDSTGGGRGVARIGTEYVSEKSFLQRIVLEKVNNPCLCGFDPLAQLPHKGDGRYCFELYPMTEEEFAVEYGEERAKTFNFTRGVEDFNWTYTNQDVKVVLIADYYCKIQKPVTIVRLAPHDFEFGETMTLPEYNKIIRDWAKIEQPPVVLERRKSTTTQIDRYQVCQNEKLDHKETFYPMLPLVVFDGDSVYIEEESGGQVREMWRPYTYPAKGPQRLMNFAMQTIGQELEDMPRNTYMVPVAGIPKAYVKNWQFPQVAGVLPYNHVNPENPQDQIPPPAVVQRQPTPPLVQETYMNSQAIIQQVMGSYDAVLGINGKEISGKAIQAGAMQSNAAAQPYYDNFIIGLQRCCEIILHLMPLIYTTPRTIPIKLPNGKRDYQVINAPYPKVDKQKEMLQKAQEMGLGGMNTQIEDAGNEEAESEDMEEAIMFNYDPHDLNITVEPGVNTHVQKQLNLELLNQAIQANPVLGEFFSRQGLPVYLESMDLPGIEALKDMVEQFQAQMQQERQNAAGQPQDVDKLVQAEMAKAQMEMQARMQKIEADFKLGLAKVAEMQQETEIKKLELELKAQEMQAKLNMEDERQASENTRAIIQDAIEVAKLQQEQPSTL